MIKEGKILGLGGVFFKSPDPKKLIAWYKTWLALPVDEYGYASLQVAGLPPKVSQVWSPFKEDTEYFLPSKKQCMFNFMVDNVEAALKRVAAGGADIVGEPESSEYGTFGWFMDPDENKVELWQPPEESKV